MSVLAKHELRSKVDVDRPFRLLFDQNSYPNFNVSTKKFVGEAVFEAHKNDRFIIKEISYQKSQDSDGVEIFSSEVLKVEFDRRPGEHVYIQSADITGERIRSEYPTIVEDGKEDLTKFKFDKGIYVSTLQIWIKLIENNASFELDGHAPIENYNSFFRQALIGFRLKAEEKFERIYGVNENPKYPEEIWFGRRDWYYLEDLLKSRKPKKPESFVKNPYDFPDPTPYREEFKLNGDSSRAQELRKVFYFNLSMGLNFIGFPVFMGVTINKMEWINPTEDQLKAELFRPSVISKLDSNCKKAIKLLKALRANVNIFERKFGDEVGEVYKGIINDTFENTSSNREIWNSPNVSWGILYGAPWKGFVVDPTAYNISGTGDINIEDCVWCCKEVELAVEELGKDYIRKYYSITNFNPNDQKPIPINYLSRPLGGYLHFAGKEDFQTGYQFSLGVPLEDTNTQRGVHYKCPPKLTYSTNDQNVHWYVKTSDVDIDLLERYIKLISENQNGDFYRIKIDKFYLSEKYRDEVFDLKVGRNVYFNFNIYEKPDPKIIVDLLTFDSVKIPPWAERNKLVRKCWSLNLRYKKAIDEYHLIAKRRRNIDPILSSMADLISLANSKGVYSDLIDLVTVERYSNSLLANQKRKIEERASDLVNALLLLIRDMDQNPEAYDYLSEVIEKDTDITFESEVMSSITSELHLSKIGQKFLDQQFKIFRYHLSNNHSKIKLDDEIKTILLLNYETQKDTEFLNEFLSANEEEQSGFWSYYKIAFKTYKKSYKAYHTRQKNLKLKEITYSMKALRKTLRTGLANLKEEKWEILKYNLGKCSFIEGKLDKIDDFLDSIKFDKDYLPNFRNNISEFVTLKKSEFADLKYSRREVQNFTAELDSFNAYINIGSFVDLISEYNEPAKWVFAMKAAHETLEHVLKRWAKTIVFQWGKYRINPFIEIVGVGIDIFCNSGKLGRFVSLGQWRNYISELGSMVGGVCFALSGIFYAFGAPALASQAFPFVGQVLLVVAIVVTLFVIAWDIFFPPEEQTKISSFMKEELIFFSKKTQNQIQNENNIKLIIEGSNNPVVTKVKDSKNIDLIKTQFKQLTEYIFHYAIEDLKLTSESKMKFTVNFARCFESSQITIYVDGCFKVNEDEKFIEILTKPTFSFNAIDVRNNRSLYSEYELDINDDTKMIEQLDAELSLDLEKYKRKSELKELVSCSKIRIRVMLNVFNTDIHLPLVQESEPIVASFY